MASEGTAFRWVQNGSVPDGQLYNPELTAGAGTVDNGAHGPIDGVADLVDDLDGGAHLEVGPGLAGVRRGRV